MADQEDYRSWAQHFGKSTLDPAVVAECTRAGLAKPPVIKRHMLESYESFGGLTVNFADPVVLGRKDRLGSGVGILYGIALHLKGSKPYHGFLPYDVRPGDGQASLRAKFGAPKAVAKDGHWDKWLIDGTEVTASYAEDLQSLTTLTVFLPEPKSSVPEGAEKS
ncbi:hypothetical protein Q9295_11835 [Xinfangfangia sp. CPCC 101601]|uniref:Uncharacterized protein n=1 Tax=Pseudogemmobacter lacusdianii TaxID=3069608 RepID=A0ABU0VZ83_9RHOB|nr:hypothetical protein [Xinfangfangia sp. CPCC 101601]MDQ2067070.1 hypothetical protein [Xinfangfangia sp. CPCC 101601]